MELKPLQSWALRPSGCSFNRTLWNWNSVQSWGTTPAISTFNRTLWNWNFVYTEVKNVQEALLIVPYGIETSKSRTRFAVPWRLLIVPYGIETLCQWIRDCHNVSFNRTLWNWNAVNEVRNSLTAVPFNRTLWNWNCRMLYTAVYLKTFNRTLWNWNPVICCHTRHVPTF